MPSSPRQAPSEEKEISMFIVLPLGNTVNEYLRRYGEKSPDLEASCPFCGEDLGKKHGKFVRGVVHRGELIPIPIYRRLCKRCRKAVSLLPPFVRYHSQIPNLLRESSVRLHDLMGVSVSRVTSRLSSAIPGGISQRTVMRWVKAFREKAESILRSLSGRLQTLFPSVSVASALRGPPVCSLLCLFFILSREWPPLRGLGALGSAALLGQVMV